jgi:hypothetical protein
VPRCEQRIDRLFSGQKTSALTGLELPPRWIVQQGWLIQLGPRAPLNSFIALELDQQFSPRQRLDGIREKKPSSTLHCRYTHFPTQRPFVREASSRTCPAALEEAWRRWQAPPSRAEAMSLVELGRSLQRQRGAGHCRPAEELVWHTKLAFPFLNLVMAILACCFGRWQRRASAVMDLGLALGLSFGIWFLLAVGWSAGRTGLLSPGWAVWFPTILGGALSGGLWGLTLRRR